MLKRIWGQVVNRFAIPKSANKGDGGIADRDRNPVSIADRARQTLIEEIYERLNHMTLVTWQFLNEEYDPLSPLGASIEHYEDELISSQKRLMDRLSHIWVEDPAEAGNLLAMAGKSLRRAGALAEALHAMRSDDKITSVLSLETRREYLHRHLLQADLAELMRDTLPDALNPEDYIKNKGMPPIEGPK